MRDNSLQFAVVREDPLIEAELIRSFGAEDILLIGSGGCTALTLQAVFPHLNISILEPNPAQTAHIQKKMAALQYQTSSERDRSFNIGTDTTQGLNACGNFESLFRCLRNFLREFVLEDLTEIFDDKTSNQQIQKKIFEHKYWNIAFDLHFQNSFLEGMFGPAAVQHAPPGSYPNYFRKAIEAALLSDGRTKNYFLHHIFLGQYRNDNTALPHYLVSDVPNYKFKFIDGNAESIPNWDRYDLIDLSNIFDWTAEVDVARIAQKISSSMRPDAKLLFRQLNHQKDFSHHFAPHFSFDQDRANQLLAKDRSFFYTKLTLASKI